VYPDRVAGTIEDLTLTLADGARLKVNRLPYSVQGSPLTQKTQKATDDSRPQPSRAFHDKQGVIQGVIDRASDGIGRAATQAFAAAPRPSLMLAAGAALLFGGCLLAMNRHRGRRQDH
jgi:hypothetical protein